jgi:hypothetical protein
MRPGVAIPLKYRHQHIEDAVLVYTTHKCAVYLLAENEERAPSFVKLQFDRTRCVRSAGTDCSPAIGIYPSEQGVSFIVELTESKWPAEANEAYTYATSSLKPRGRHFVVSNHDVFHEILAESFSEYFIDQESDEYEFVKKLFV